MKTEHRLCCPLCGVVLRRETEILMGEEFLSWHCLQHGAYKRVAQSWIEHVTTQEKTCPECNGAAQVKIEGICCQCWTKKMDEMIVKISELK